MRYLHRRRLLDLHFFFLGKAFGHLDFVCGTAAGGLKSALESDMGTDVSAESKDGNTASVFSFS